MTGLQDDVILEGMGHLIIPTPMPQASKGIGYIYRPTTTVHEEHLRYPLWADVSVARALGFPIRIIATQHGDASMLNELADALALDTDPECPDFGRCHWTPKWTGGALLVREDLKPIHSSHIDTLHRYVDGPLKEVREVRAREAKGEVVDRREIAARLLTPQAFKKFFDEMKEVEKLREPRAWKDVACPADATGELTCVAKKPPRALM